jgi:hypothetical protein
VSALPWLQQAHAAAASAASAAAAAAAAAAAVAAHVAIALQSRQPLLSRVAILSVQRLSSGVALNFLLPTISRRKSTVKWYDHQKHRHCGTLVKSMMSRFRLHFASNTVYSSLFIF